MSFVKKHLFLIIFILGLLLRFSVLFLDYSFDVNNHLSWAQDLWRHGFLGFFDKVSSEVYASLYPNYPPAALLLFYLAYPLQQIVHGIVWFLNVTIPIFPSKIIFFVETRAFLAAMMKIPAVLFDLTTAWMVYLYARQFAPKIKILPILGASLILFNPAFFYNSAYWGQIDVIPIFFTLVAMYLVMYTPRYLLSALVFTLALLVKPTALVFLPVYAVIFFRKFGMKNFLIAVVVSNFVFWLSFLPFLKDYTLMAPYHIYSQKILAAQSLPFVTNGAFNFWMIVTQFEGIKDTTPFLFSLSYRMWGYAVTGAITLWVLYVLTKFKKNQQNIFYALFLVAFACFLFLTKMHERYLMLPLPFLLLYAFQTRGYLKWFYLLSFLSFINLYHSWPVPKVESAFKLVDSAFGYNFFSAANVLLFFFLLWHYNRLSQRS